ncbi:short-chain dehydrogenase [Mucilaginibacter sp. PPCGB 2223]|uniref:SDR family oxidoreductase n=1 Tax=Mucilaginibacter sp. PPCGB 2223 TaxID=1886027 RepID=UPI000825A90F|nr:SDR family oxidoreductase [Mucilaginibacter sp. PPCGB 2223]OCX50492.1 short-chain dehydrogenase [Mucilaginibacter sp. PPCGB 2223]
MNNTNSISGKTVIILGGSAGIGLATAKLAAQEGARVIIASGNQARIDAALQQLPAGSQGYAVDLSKEESIAGFFKTIGAFDHLIYTAGENLSLSPIVEADIEKARSFFNVRYWGAYTAIKYGAPKIKQGGSIVLTSGAAGRRGGASWSAASSICAAMEGLTRSLAIELAPIRVNCIVPGFVKTNLWDYLDSETRETMYANAASALPVKYVAGPEDIALSYIYLLKQPYSTGESLLVDGGHVLI